MSLIFKLNDGQSIPSLGLGLGSWQITENEGVETLLNAALEAGYRHFDINFFPENDRILGKIFQKWISSGRLQRDDLYIVAKLPPTGMWPYRVNEFLKVSLRNLGLEYVDLYLIQFPVGFQYVDPCEAPPANDNEGPALDNKIHLEAVWKAMEYEVKRQRTKSIGFCNFNQSQIQRILNSCKIVPALIQMEGHISLQQKELKQICDDLNIRLCASNPLGPPTSPSQLLRDPELLCLGVKYQKTPDQIALQFFVQSGVVAVQDCDGVEGLMGNIGVFDFQLDQEDMELLMKIECGSPQSQIAHFDVKYPGADKHPEFPWK